MTDAPPTPPANWLERAVELPWLRASFFLWLAAFASAPMFDLPRYFGHSLDWQFFQFFDEIAPLGEKLGPILVQLPPSLVFEPSAAADFFSALRNLWDGEVALEFVRIERRDRDLLQAYLNNL
jgi:hypothetical protein